MKIMQIRAVRERFYRNCWDVDIWNGLLVARILYWLHTGKQVVHFTNKLSNKITWSDHLSLKLIATTCTKQSQTPFVILPTDSSATIIKPTSSTFVKNAKKLTRCQSQSFVHNYGNSHRSHFILEGKRLKQIALIENYSKPDTYRNNSYD
jgi:hypothetical protein